jgi:beta-galactosidase
MKPILLFLLLSFAPLEAAGRDIVPLDSGWLFLQEDAPGAEAPDYGDHEWRRVEVPHDWSIEGAHDPKHPTGPGGGFLPAGVGWYRRPFTLPAAWAGRRVHVEFDGVMAHSDVWVNGVHLGRRPNGYVSFGYDLTDHVRFGAPNLLAVRADNSGQPASRWYTGAGIYRRARLVVTDPVHFEKWSPFVSPRLAGNRAVVTIEGTVLNRSAQPSSVSVEIRLVGPDGKEAALARTQPLKVASGKRAEFREEVILENPVLWDVENPQLYEARLTLRSGEAERDSERIPFGIREARFDSDTGFWLNGKNLKIKGVCLHHDGGAFGAAVPLAVWEERLGQLRKLGVNAIRTAHNPPAPDFLDLCDRMGFLVMVEMFDCWTIGKNAFDYHRDFERWAHIDARDTVLRDRNHPSVILYSAGNEIRDTVQPDLGKKILAGLVDIFHRFDPTRPVTQGLFRPNVSGDYTNGLADLLDVIGTNYRDLELLEAWKEKPGRKIVGTEQRHELATWLAARDHRQHAGQFLWSGIDYLGESLGWPMIGAGFGLLDRTGAIKPMAYERMAWWSDQPVVHVVRRTLPPKAVPTDPGFVPLTHSPSQFADWTPTDPNQHEETVEAYSNCEEVELYLNGKSLGKKPRPADDAPRMWKVPFEPGTLLAIGRNGGRDAARHELRTAGKAEKIVLSVDRRRLAPGWDDVVRVTATVTDRAGVPVPDASHPVTFVLSGPGVLAAVDNGDNASAESYRGNVRRAYGGRCYAWVRALSGPGKITVTASAPGLKGTVTTVPLNNSSGLCVAFGGFLKDKRDRYREGEGPFRQRILLHLIGHGNKSQLPERLIERSSFQAAGQE